MFSLSTLYFTTLDWSFTMRIKQWERNINVVLGWAGICWEEQNTSSPEKACVGRYKNQDDWVQDLSKQLGKLCKFKGSYRYVNITSEMIRKRRKTLPKEKFSVIWCIKLLY